ncbi:hypothetical protein H0X32_00755 [Patescibacteria group bacterium]|nr:hypothetical protein [Patescibacteria group bacterium]
MSSRIKIIVAVLVVAVLLGAAYLLLFNNNNTNAAVTVEGGATSAAEVTFLNLSSQLQPISFDTTIFTDPRFMALVDIHTAILPETSGRKDPFAPI